MTRTAYTDQLRVDPPAVPVDDAFVSVLAAHAAASRPTRPPHRERSRLAVVLVAAAVAATTLGAAWAARELATRAPAPATHERRVEPTPDPAPSPAHTRRATVEETSGDPTHPAARGTGRHRHLLATPTTGHTAATGPARPSTRSVRPPAPTARRTHEADEPRDRTHDSADDSTDKHTDDHSRDRADEDRTGARDPSGADDTTDDSTGDSTGDSTDRPTDGNSDDSTDGPDGTGTFDANGADLVTRGD